MIHDVLSQASLFLYGLPIWLVAIIKIAMLLLALEFGYRIGFRKYKIHKEAKLSGGKTILSSIFAILGLIFAFTFSAGVHRYDLRNQEVIHESNAIGTAFLRADLVAEPGQTKIKQILFDYTRARIISTEDKLELEQQVEKLEVSNLVLSDLWPATMAAISQQPQIAPAERMVLVSAINDVLDLNTLRNAAFLDRLPSAVLWLLMVISVIALAEAGFNSGLLGTISRLRYTVFSVILALLLMTITDYDRPRDGLILVHQESMVTALEDMHVLLKNR